MKSSLPPIVRAAETLLAEVQRAVTAMARRHRYDYGKRLSNAALSLAQLSNRAWHEKQARADWLQQLVRAVDDFKILLRLGRAVQAFPSSGQFQLLCRQAYELGSQCGGWIKSHLQHPMGQNAPAPPRAGQRAPILSSRAAQPSGAAR